MSFNIMERNKKELKYLDCSLLSSSLIDKYLACLSNVNAEEVRRKLGYSNNSDYEGACKALVDLVYSSELINILEEDELKDINELRKLD